MSEGLRESVYIYSGLAYKWQWLGLKEAGGGEGSHRRNLWAHREFQCKCMKMSEFVSINPGCRVVKSFKLLTWILPLLSL